MITGVVIFLAISLYFTLSESFKPQGETEFANQLFFLTAGLTMALLPAAYIFFKWKSSGIDIETAGLDLILTRYKSAFMVKMGLIEMPAFFSIVVMLLTGNQWLLIQIIAVILVMIINRPTAEKIVGEMKLDRSQVRAIQKL